MNLQNIAPTDETDTKDNMVNDFVYMKCPK